MRSFCMGCNRLPYVIFYCCIFKNYPLFPNLPSLFLLPQGREKSKSVESARHDLATHPTKQLEIQIPRSYVVLGWLVAMTLNSANKGWKVLWSHFLRKSITLPF